MNKILDSLYDRWKETAKSSAKLKVAIDIIDGHFTREDAEKLEKFILDGNDAEKKKAFQAGFQTAVQLLTGGMQS